MRLLRARLVWAYLSLCYRRAEHHLRRADQLRDPHLPADLFDKTIVGAYVELHERLADFFYALAGDDDARQEVWERGTR